MNKRGLGKGLGALIPESEEKLENSVTELKITEIEVNEKQPRKAFKDEALAELAESIREHGVVQPIIVRKVGNGYQIVAGERRWRASRLAGLKTIPAIVKEFSNVEVMEIALIENLQREDLNSLEEANAYRSLMEEYNMTQEDIARRIGKSRPAIANSLRLLQLQDKIKAMIFEGKISEGHARALLAVEDLKRQLDIAERVVNEQLSVRQVEKLVKDVKGKNKKEARVPEEQIEIRSIEDRLKHKLGTKVKIAYKSGKGSIEIEYYSDDEFEKLIEKLEK